MNTLKLNKCLFNKNAVAPLSLNRVAKILFDTTERKAELFESKTPLRKTNDFYDNNLVIGLVYGSESEAI